MKKANLIVLSVLLVGCGIKNFALDSTPTPVNLDEFSNNVKVDGDTITFLHWNFQIDIPTPRWKFNSEVHREESDFASYFFYQEGRFPQIGLLFYLIPAGTTLENFSNIQREEYWGETFPVIENTFNDGDFEPKLSTPIIGYIGHHEGYDYSAYVVHVVQGTTGIQILFSASDPQTEQEFFTILSSMEFTR